MRRLRALAIGLVAVGVAAVVAAVVVGEDGGEKRIDVGARSQTPVPDESPCPGDRPPRPRVNRVNEDRAFSLLGQQVELGPRPAGSATSRGLAERLRRLLPNGRFEPVGARTDAERPLRNVVGVVRGREPGRVVVVGAHYDTKDLPGVVGANDGAGGTAAVVEIARSIRPGELDPTVVFILFDGEESPRGTSEAVLERAGLRGSRAAARRYPGAAAMVLLDFVADRRLSIPREANSTPGLWESLRAAARRAGVGCAFPAASREEISDDHKPFLEAGVPSIDLIDFEFRCWHRRCDNMSAVSERSLDASVETVRELLARL
jgi:glutaminyl-peptide cyclotransferase